MATLDYSEIVPRKIILVDDEPFEVISSHVFRKQKAKPQNATKLKNLLTGRMVEISFHAADRAEEADMGSREVKYLYNNKGEFWFCDPKNPADRFTISINALGENIKFVKPNSIVDARTFNDNIISAKLPIKVDLLVTESAPAVRGNTSGNATKQVQVETGATINVPMFINEGDIIRVNTETGEYTERAEKA